MAITNAEYAAWLRDPSAIRVLLADLHHANGVEYVASLPYVSKPTDSAPNRIYNDLLISAVDVTSRIDAVLEIGDLELVDDGGISDWVGYRWRGYPVVLRMGSPDWSIDDFRVIARQISAGVSSARRGRMTLSIYDATARLDTPIVRDLLPDGSVVPLVFGSVFGAEAIRIDGATLTYRVSQLPVTSLVVRDGNGPVMSHIADYANGQFSLAAYTTRSVSCQVSEPHDTAIEIIQWVASQYGLTVVTGASIPSSVLGLRYSGDVSGRQILDDVCQAISGYWYINLLGELVVNRMISPVSADIVITADDIEYNKIQLTEIQQPLKQLTILYGRNHNPLNEVAGSVNDADPALADRLRTESLAVSGNNPTTEYPLAPEEEIETALQVKADAEAELARRLALRSVRREIWEITVFLTAAENVIGKSVQVNHPRISGRIGCVISVRQSPTSERLILEILF